MIPQSEGKRLEGKSITSQVKNEYLDTPPRGSQLILSVNPAKTTYTNLLNLSIIFLSL